MLRAITLAAALVCAAALTATAEDLVTLDAAELAAAWPGLVGQRVQLAGRLVGVASTVDKKYPKAFYGRQGMKAIFVDAAGLDPAVAAALDPACKPYTEEQLAACAYDVTALLSANGAGDGPKLSEPLFVKR